MGKFVKGQSGNPNGRPKKGTTLTDLMREFLDTNAIGKDGKETTITHKELFIRAVYKKAIEGGDPFMTRLIWNYIDGMPIQKVKHAGDLEDDPIAVTQVFVPEKKKEGAE